jgi:spore coat polysaccharide biosynthesis protein SpsF (cytidylyltransferase family)
VLVAIATRSTARACGGENIIEVLGDNAMVHADLIDDVFERFASDRLDYAASLTNEYPHAPAGLRRFALGVRVQVLSVEALARCAERAEGARYREHTSAYLAEHPEAFAVGFVEASGRWEALNRPELNLAVNHAENLELLRELVGEDRDPRRPDLPELVRRYDKRPELHAWMGPQPTLSAERNSR